MARDVRTTTMRIYNPIERRLYGRMRMLVIGAVWRALDQCDLPYDIRCKVARELRHCLDVTAPPVDPAKQAFGRVLPETTQ